jgi:hypothetical protein
MAVRLRATDGKEAETREDLPDEDVVGSAIGGVQHDDSRHGRIGGKSPVGGPRDLWNP